MEYHVSWLYIYNEGEDVIKNEAEKAIACEKRRSLKRKIVKLPFDSEIVGHTIVYDAWDLIVTNKCHVRHVINHGYEIGDEEIHRSSIDVDELKDEWFKIPGFLDKEVFEEYKKIDKEIKDFDKLVLELRQFQYLKEKFGA